MITRDSIIEKAIHDCLKQMYLMAQPPADWDEICDKYARGEYNDSAWYRHYLPQDVADDIMEHYMRAYRIPMEWKHNVDTVMDYLEEGGSKDVWIKGDGDSPGHRGYEKVPSLRESLIDICGPNAGNDAYEKCIEHIQYCRDFYEPVLEERRFKTNVYLAAPSFVKDPVEKFWRNMGKYIKLKDAKWNDDKGKYEFVEECN